MLEPARGSPKASSERAASLLKPGRYRAGAQAIVRTVHTALVTMKPQTMHQAPIPFRARMIETPVPTAKLIVSIAIRVRCMKCRVMSAAHTQAVASSRMARLRTRMSGAAPGALRDDASMGAEK